MQFGRFDEFKNYLDNEYSNIEWLDGTGLNCDELEKECLQLIKDNSDRSPVTVKAMVFDYILRKGRLAVDKYGFFCEKVDGRRIMLRITWRRMDDCRKENLPELYEAEVKAENGGLYVAHFDFGHISLDSRKLLKYGIGGLLERVHTARDKKTSLTEDQKVFYDACEMSLNALSHYFQRLSEAVKERDRDVSDCLLKISTKAPETTYEALQLLIGYLYVHEYIGGARDRTLGRLDDCLYSYYKNDLSSGRYSEEEIKELYKYFLNKIWAMRIPYDQPFELGGLRPDGKELTNELSYLIVNAYNDINVHSPKIHIRVSEKTPDSFVKLVLNCIRGGNSSFVFCNDAVTVKALCDVGISKEEALDYVLIGCYEPAAWGSEVPCTGNGSLNLAKCLELALNCGCDMKTGELLGEKTPVPESFEDIVAGVKTQIKYASDSALYYISETEKLYPRVYSDPLMSCMMDECLEKGIDAYAGSAKYNNSSLNVAGIATLTDSLCAIKKIVYEDKKVSLKELCEILKSDWKQNEKLRIICSNLKEKYGNGNEVADAVAREMAEYVASCITGKPNGRGGVFKAGLFSIDRCFSYGKKTHATPDGRYSGQPISKNLCATTAKDRCGITALINSVTEMDHSRFPNGSVLDVIMHPSAVSGDDGILAMYGLLISYFKRGGFAMHGNVFDATELKKAQVNPEKYATLQVRVCGWNVFFVNLSKEEQDEFIKQTESIS